MEIEVIDTGVTAPAPSASGPEARAEKRLLTVCAGTAFGYLAALAALFANGGWILDGARRPIVTDFIAIWSAGRLALKGTAVSAYNGVLQHAAEVAAMGRDFHGYYGWPYPPSFLFVAAALASLPYAWAFVLWVGASLILYGSSVAGVTRRWPAMSVAFASPWVLASAMVGQNGLLTAAIIGFVLLTIDRRPVLSGVLLGLLAYKPQFGLLFPLALAASGRWRAFVWAAVSVLALASLSSVVFGVDALSAFLHGLPATTQALLTNGGVGWNKLQSAYGLIRSLGGSNAAGWTAQAIMTSACAVAVAALWRGQAPQPLKAAALAVGAILATPYVFAYDLPVLSVAAAFLYRHRSFDRLEYAALALAALVVIPGLFVALPFGLLASLAVAAIVGRRVIAAQAEKSRPEGSLSAPARPCDSDQVSEFSLRRVRRRPYNPA
jgi:hypothetical protein